jgi:hypothetical protein
MKRYLVANVAALVLGLAVLSSQTMAQVSAQPDLPSVDVAAVRPSSTPGTVGPTPLFAYKRPTEREKVRLFVFDAFGPYAFAKSALAGGFQQETKSPSEWGEGWGAFGTRVASNFGIQLVTTTTRYGMAEIFREDAAYYRCGCRGFFPRVGHALISTLTARHGEDGHTTFSFSGLAAPYAGTMTALAWYPDRYGVKDGFRMGNYNLLAQAAGNLALEFIYGGPHTLFSHVGRSKLEGGAAAQNP